MKKSLTSLPFSPLKLGEVKPLGWLKNQLQTQTNGLSGHLDESWPDVMNSGWIGGNLKQEQYHNFVPIITTFFFFIDVNHSNSVLYIIILINLGFVIIVINSIMGRAAHF